MEAKTFLSLCFAIITFHVTSNIHSQNKDKSSLAPTNLNSTAQFAKMNINNISTFIYNNGEADNAPNGSSGFEFPNGSTKTVVYESGFLWAGKVNGQLRSGGSWFSTGLRPGKILPDGTVDNPNSSSVRVFRVRPDYKTADLSLEIKDEGKDRQMIYNQYEKDWNEWPATSGAPFKDINSNGIYEPSIDIPGVSDANQTIWFVANDLDSLQTKSLFGALPMGIEMQTTVWAYKNVDPLNNMIFKRYLIINKSNTKIEDMYFGLWSDTDLGGDAGDELAGCDSILNLGYLYNGDDYDPSYDAFIPSEGVVLLQGPIVNGNPSDKATFKNKIIKGKKNLTMTSFSAFGNGVALLPDPTYYTYQGTIDLYNLLTGNTKSGLPWIIPDIFGGGITKFPFSGDCVLGKGYLDGVIIRKGERRFMVNTGPFNLAPGDTQEVIFVQIAAGGDEGVYRLAAVSLLKEAASFSHFFYKNNFNPPSITSNVLDVLASEMDREIILTWGGTIDKINEIEKINSSTYSFQGYNVYQISKNELTLGQKKRVATFDIIDGKLIIYDEVIDPESGFPNFIIRQFGSDSGIQRFMSIKKNYFRDEALNNGSDYDYGISYYLTSNDFNYPFTYQESPLSIVSVKPQSAKPGVHPESKFGDFVTAKHIGGNSNAEVTAMIITPLDVTGEDYEITFRYVNGKTTFDLYNLSREKTILSNQTNLSGDSDYIVTDGFILKVKNDSKKSLTENDVYSFTAPKVTINANLNENDIEKINVFPNPYYGAYKNEFNKYDRHITFSHLPQRAIIRIFNLAGQLVRKLEKDSPDQFLRWNMLNEDYYQLPSGIYIAHIELPDFEKVKILKLALVSEVFVPDRF